MSMKPIFFNSNKELEKVIDSKKISKVIKENGFWSEKLNEKEMALVGYTISRYELDNDVNPTLVEEEDKVFDGFQYDSAAKLVFINYISKIWNSENTMILVARTLGEMDSFEIKYGKSSVVFTEEEVKECLLELGKEKEVFGLTFKAKIMSEYFDFYSEAFKAKKKDNVWKAFTTAKSISDLLSREYNEINLRRQDLIKLFDRMDNPQEGIIPILIFEGIRLSAYDDSDELRHLKVEDIDFEENRIKIEKKENLKERYIEIEEDLCERIKVVKQTEYTFMYNENRKDMIFRLKDTPYLLKPSMFGRSLNTSSDAVISQSGARKRIHSAIRELEMMVPVSNLSSSYIINCGKSHYVNKYMSKGLSEKEAIIETLKRFGEWTYDETSKNESGIQANRSKISRLKNSYQVFS